MINNVFKGIRNLLFNDLSNIVKVQFIFKGYIDLGIVNIILVIGLYLDLYKIGK